MDKRLRNLLDRDDQMQLVSDGDLQDPHAKAALRLYRESFMSLETVSRGNSRNIEKEAFQAVMRDDAEALQALLGRGVAPGLTNPGGHTLLQLARERGKAACEEALLDA